MSKKEIVYWNRSTQQVESEHIYGEAFMRWFYETKPGLLATDKILSRPLFSELYGRLQSSWLSARKVKPFIRDFHIDMEEYETGPFASFNDFFIRQFRPGKRPFAPAPEDFPAPAEARYFAWERISEKQTFPVKGMQLSAPALLGNAEKAAPFVGGPLLLARLCPTDYHRFHFPDAGRVIDEYPVHGPLHSVSPVAIASKGDILVTNERHVTILETKNFGKLAYVEVGAICVGKIVQSYDQTRPFERGAEKGYFLFGGSTVIVLGEPGAWKPDADLLDQTGIGREVWCKIGTKIARRT